MIARILTVLFFLVVPVTAVQAGECVILLHGLARSAASMDKLAESLRERGYVTANVGYPSRREPIAGLARGSVPKGLASCRRAGAEEVSFVTHSMGGILLRQYLQEKSIANLRRVVMLGPPNQGSEVVDGLGKLPGFQWLAGPAAAQLGTRPGSVPRALGPVAFPLGVIAGTRALNPLFSLFVPNPDDGVVSIASARVAGMCAFVALPVTHTFMMYSNAVIEETLAFLENGRFNSPAAENGLCMGTSDLIRGPARQGGRARRSST